MRISATVVILPRYGPPVVRHRRTRHPRELVCETCDPVDPAAWSPETPARGQCAVTALIVQEFLGGDLLLAEVRNADGSRQGLHYWNRLPDGTELDLTREQFTASETVQAPDVVPRPADLSRGRLFPQYQALSRAVRSALSRA